MAIDPINGAGSVPLVTMPKQNDSTDSKESFTKMIGNAIDSFSATQNKADTVSMQAATGQLTDIHDLTIATTEATLATEFTVAVRNKALEAFNDIMRMPV